MNQLEKCPLCESTDSKLFLESKDYSYTQEAFKIVECNGCGFRYTNPIPTADKIGGYYKADNYISHTSSKKGMFERIYHMVRKRTIKKKFQLVSKYTSKSLLDFGCGTGDFLHYVTSQGWETLGMEPDDDARKLASDKGVPVKSTTELHNLENGSFKGISMWHVLEHVYDLNPDFKKLTDVLDPDGYMFIAVPNCSSHDAALYGEKWAAYDVPIHLYHFTPASIKTLADKYNLKLVDTLPMKFDSYYVSMLSEKYKSGNDGISAGNFIKGMWRGMISNMKASKGTYSSQIYVLKKA